MHFLRRIIVHTNNMITAFVLVYLFETVVSASISQAKTLEDPAARTDKQTWIISQSKSQTQQVSDLIHILQRLSVLSNDGNISSCVSLESIERVGLPAATVMSDDDDEASEFNVVLKFKRRYFNHIITSTDAHAADDTGGGYKTTSDVTVCKHRSVFSPGPGIDSLSRKQTNGTSVTTEPNDKNGTGTMVAQPPLSANRKERGLSRTQIAVIATCAAVLGTLFIIVAGLRVRSCLKRYRTNREAALNINRRASSMGLNGSNNVSSSNVRRDSSSSKASRQSNSTFKSGGDVSLGGRHAQKPHFLAHTTSPLHSYDHKPLLPVTSTGSHSEKGSSHGSLAFIDDTDTHSKFKATDVENESDTGTEDDPLLRKSPDSGSSIDASMADLAKLEDECMTFDNDNDVTNEGLSNDTKPPCEDTQASIDSKQALSGIEITDVNTDTSGKNNEIQPKSNGTELSAETQNSTNALNGPENANNNGLCLADTLVVTSGLCQSDGSLSNSPSYQYGNQAEYTWGVYGNVAYCTPYDADHDHSHRHHHGFYVHVGAVDEISALEIDRDSSRENGLSPDKKSPSELSYRSLSISNASSGEPLLPNVCRSRTPSDGNILIYGRDNWALDESPDEDANGKCSVQPGSDVTPNTNTCRIVSQIIPLAIYNEPNGKKISIENQEDKIRMT